MVVVWPHVVIGVALLVPLTVVVLLIVFLARAIRRQGPLRKKE